MKMGPMIDALIVAVWISIVASAAVAVGIIAVVVEIVRHLHGGHW